MSKTFNNFKMKSIFSYRVSKGINKFIFSETNKIEEFFDKRGVFVDPYEVEGEFSLDNIAYLSGEPNIRLASRYYSQRRNGNIPQVNKRLWNNYYKRTKRL